MFTFMLFQDVKGLRHHYVPTSMRLRHHNVPFSMRARHHNVPSSMTLFHHNLSNITRALDTDNKGEFISDVRHINKPGPGTVVEGVS